MDHALEGGGEGAGGAAPRIPSWLLRRPPLRRDAATTAAFDALLDEALAGRPCGSIDYSLAVPRWQFLAHVAERRGYLLHGSGDPDIARFEPRKAEDANAFGRQIAVYAAADGIWPIFFAVVDSRRAQAGILVNACVHIPGEPEPLYFFSIGQAALQRGPWREGTVYILPRTGFEPEPPITMGGLQVRSGQLASRRAVAPLAKLAVTPEDFPFLDRVRGHDDAVTMARAKANPGGFPWLDDEEASEVEGTPRDRP